MRRGDLYRVDRPGAGDPKRFRVFVVVSRQTVIDSRFSTVICAPVYTERYGLSTEVAIGAEQGLKHDSSIHCDALVSVQKSLLLWQPKVTWQETTQPPSDVRITRKVAVVPPLPAL